MGRKYLFTFICLVVASNFSISGQDDVRGVDISGPAVFIASDHTELFTPPSSGSILLDNSQQLFNGVGTGVGGANESILQDVTLGMSTIGFGHSVSGEDRLADDFTNPGPNCWAISSIVFYAYQTDSSTTSTINAVNLRIWDGPPGTLGRNVVYGDTTTNLLTATDWANVYRVNSEAASGSASTRPVMANTVNLDLTLCSGTYWLDWQTAGTLSAGPYAAPNVITGQAITGNSIREKNNSGTWENTIDSDTEAQQGFPFIIVGVSATSVPTLSQYGLLTLMVLLVLAAIFLLRRRVESVS